MKKRPPAKRRGEAVKAAPLARPPVPPERAPTYDDILAIARLIESGSRFSEFRLRSGDIEVEVKRGNAAAAPQAQATPAPAPATAPAPAAAQTAAPAPGAAIPDLPPGTHLVKSPMVGTFYCAPEPGAKPFVEPGTKVEASSIVCIIEVMKLMNSVEAGVAGTVTHVFVENAAPVEAGQPLVAIQP